MANGRWVNGKRMGVPDELLARAGGDSLYVEVSLSLTHGEAAVLEAVLKVLPSHIEGVAPLSRYGAELFRSGCSELVRALSGAGVPDSSPSGEVLHG